MVGDVRVVRSGASAELWGAVGSRRLSPTARTLPKTARRLPTPATVCHELPGTAAFSRRGWSAVFRRNFDLINGHDATLIAGLALGRIDSLKPPETRSISSNLLLETEGKGTRSPVTVCHINFGGGWARVRKKKRRPVGRVLRRGRRPSGGPSPQCPDPNNAAASAAPQGQRVVAQGTALGSVAPPRLRSSVGATWVLAPVHNGSFGCPRTARSAMIGTHRQFRLRSHWRARQVGSHRRFARRFLLMSPR